MRRNPARTQSLGYQTCLQHSITSLWLGASPETFYVKFIVTMSTLFTLRFIIYRPKGHHYYMAECVFFYNASTHTP